MFDNTHHINKVIFDIEATGDTELNGFSDELNDYFERQIIPVIEKSLDRVFIQDKPIVIDQLTISLGTLSKTGWKKTLLEILPPHLEKALSEISNNESDDPIAGNTELLIFYLENGRFPWFYNPGSWPDFEESCSRVLRKDEIIRVVQQVRNNNYLQIRLIQAFTDHFLLFVFNQLGIAFPVLEFKTGLMDYLHKQGFSFPSTSIFRVWYWEAIFSSLRINATDIRFDNMKLTEFLLDTRRIDAVIKNTFFSGKAPDSKLLINTVLIFLQDHFPEILNDLKNQSDTTDTFPGKRIINTTGNGIGKENSKESEGLNEYTDQFPSSHVDKNEHGSGNQVDFVDFIPSEPSDSISRKTIWDDTVLSDMFDDLKEVSEYEVEEYVYFAGIVILHPFLKDLFTNCGLLVDENWKSRAHQVHAVQLLAYLSKGELFCPENEMTLLKHLSGIPWKIPVSPDLELTESEIEEAESVLRTVIKHWDILKNTSTTGLRESFIQRNGKLRKNGNDWMLYVEQKSIDILVNRLPWNVSFIKLPWLENILHVHWS